MCSMYLLYTAETCFFTLQHLFEFFLTNPSLLCFYILYIPHPIDKQKSIHIFEL